MRSTTATSAGAAVLALLASAVVPAGAAGPLDRMLGALPPAVLDRLGEPDQIRTRCGDGALCGARRLVELLDGRARLEPVRHPTTDTIRWAVTRSSLRLSGTDGALQVAILRLGRTVVPDLHTVIAAARSSGTGIVLDLRELRGGRFGRMLAVASLLIGAKERALALVEGGRTSWLDLPAPSKEPALDIRRVLVGPATASAGEVLAALLAAHGGAELCGRGATAGQATLKAVIPVDHDWRLLVERAAVVVPGQDLRGGLRPGSEC